MQREARKGVFALIPKWNAFQLGQEEEEAKKQEAGSDKTSENFRLCLDDRWYLF